MHFCTENTLRPQSPRWPYHFDDELLVDPELLVAVGLVVLRLRVPDLAQLRAVQRHTYAKTPSLVQPSVQLLDPSPRGPTTKPRPTQQHIGRYLSSNPVYITLSG